MTDWLMVIITAIYVVATIIICVLNYKSAKLANMSNEINLICKIVEIEQSRLLEIKKAIDNFVTNASLSYQITDCKEPNVRINAITDSFQLFQRCISVDDDTDKMEYARVTHCAVCFYESSIEICKWLNEEYDGSESDNDAKKRIRKVIEIQSHFFEAKEQYILSREKKISKALLGNLSLLEVKKMYCSNCSNDRKTGKRFKQ